MISKNNIIKQMFVEAKEYFDPAIQQNQTLQREAFIAAYEGRAMRPIKPDHAVLGGLALSIAMIAGVQTLQYVLHAPAAIRAMTILPVTAVEIALIYGAKYLAKVFNRHVDRLVQPVDLDQSANILQDRPIKTLADAAALGAYCRQPQRMSDIQQALGRVEGKKLLGPVELQIVINQAARPNDMRLLPPGRFKPFQASGHPY